ncbi:MAG: hypothetical protein H7320_03275 [Ferruginibacter sp.]|nr:hypothetical protein [Ferruginibacter sp.]
MSFIHFVKLILKNILWLLLIPLLMAGSIFYFTRSEKKVFSSETVIYTGIASGYNLSGNHQADFYATSNAFDNLLTLILSRETKQEVAIQLLAEHLYMKKYDPAVLSWVSYDELNKLVPDSVKQKLVKPTLEQTIVAVTNARLIGAEDLVYKIINSENPYYSLYALRNIKSFRVSSSDLVRISYETNDAAICKRTLDLLTEVFVRKHRLLREGETESVIAYFEKEVHKSFIRLDSLENVFLEFNKRNDIINYYEQTKAVAGEKENLYALNHTLEMDRMANNSALDKVNDNIKGRIYQILYGSNIIKEREKLSDVYNKIALNDILGKSTTSTKKTDADSLRSISGGIEKQLQASLDKLYTQTNIPNGIPTKTVLDEWLKSTLAFEESKARLTVMDKRKKEFADEYRKFAPIGAILKKMERQITVAEQEYLELLHSLSLARLAQQNNEITSKLTIVDPAYLPLKPNPSIRLILVIVGFLAGFIIILGVLLGNYLLNQTLQQPIRAIKQTGLPLLGIYPVIQANAEFMQRANLRILQQLLSKIDYAVKPLIIGVFSIQKGEGKSTIIEVWIQGLRDAGEHAEHMVWTKENPFVETANGGIVFVEFPALENLLLTNSNMLAMPYSILVCRANRVWNSIDKEMLAILTSSTKTEPKALLNGVDNNFAEDFIGEVPKKRNFFRSLFKRFIKREYGSRKTIRKRQFNHDKR